jgi:hypothetical protein
LTVEGCDSAREVVDEVVELVVGDCPVDVPVPLGKFTVEVVASDQDLQSAPSSDQASQVRRWAPSGSGTDTDLELTEYGPLAAREADIGGEGELAARAACSPADR